MITGFEVAAVLKLVDQVTGPLNKIMASVRELNAQIKLARDGFVGFSAAATPGIAGAITEVNELTAAWGRAAAAARTASGAAATSARSGAAAAVGGGAVGGAGGGRARLGGWLAGGGSAHVTGPGIGLPGGSHARLGGTPAMIGAGLAAYGIYEAANMEDAVWQLIYHSGQKNTQANKDKFRKIIEEGMKSTGYDLKEVAGAAIQDTRMMQGTPGGGLDQLPEMLKIAAIEARLKKTSLQESMTAIVGFAHMFKAYDAESIKKLAPVFAYLSTANPTSLGSMEKAAGYAVPMLQSSMGIDPVTTVLLGTALSRAGITSTKSGTWLRELGTRGLPSGLEKHDDALKRLGLLDENGKATWLDAAGKPDLEKAIDTASKAAANIPVEERPGVMKNAFGTQGAGALAVLGDPAVNAQIKSLRKEMESEEFKNRYGTALEEYGKNSPVQQARTTMQSFNVAMVELSEKALPGATAALSAFSGVLHGLNFIQAATPKGDKQIGLPMQRGAIPRLWNYLTGPKEGDGALKPEKQSFLQGPGAAKATLAPISLSLNIDGRQLGQAVTEQLEHLVEHASSAPSYNGLSNFARADSGMSVT
jgi:hypothetical protein